MKHEVLFVDLEASFNDNNKLNELNSWVSISGSVWNNSLFLYFIFHLDNSYYQSSNNINGMALFLLDINDLRSYKGQ